MYFGLSVFVGVCVFNVVYRLWDFVLKILLGLVDMLMII